MTWKTAILSLFLLPALAPGNGWLGVYLADAEGEVRIAEVLPGSPAEGAGLRAGDVILELDGEGTATVETFVEKIQVHNAGDRVRLKVRRGEAELEVSVRLAARTAVVQAPGTAPQPGFLGVGIREEAGGLVVDRVFPGSPAARAGIAEGDRLVRLHGEPVGQLDDVDRIMAGLAAGTRISVNLENDKGSSSLIVRLEARSVAGPGAVPPPVPPAPVTPPPEREPLDFTSNLEEAKRLSRQQQRPLLLVFGASWSPESQAQRRALGRVSLREVLRGYVRVWLDTDRAGDLAEAHSVRDVPHIEILGPDGDRVFEHAGYLPPESLLQALRTHASPEARAEARLRAALADLERLDAELQELRELLQELLRRDR